MLPSVAPVNPRRVLASISARAEVSPRHFRLRLHAPQIALQAQAGQFVHILPREAASNDPFLRRAFSIMKAEGEEIEILFRAQGRGTQQLAASGIGKVLDVLGPLGKPFDLTLFHVKQPRPEPIMVGGGIGVPPLVFLARTLGEAGILPQVVIGARSAQEIIGVDEFRALGIEPSLTTDDGSRGQQGNVTQEVENILENGRAALPPVIYTCGPMPMLRAVAEVAARYEAACQVSLEENMPCGIGVCNGCVVATRGATSDYERFKRVCVFGPAMWATEVDWEAL